MGMYECMEVDGRSLCPISAVTHCRSGECAGSLHFLLALLLALLSGTPPSSPYLPTWPPGTSVGHCSCKPPYREEGPGGGGEESKEGIKGMQEEEEEDG